MCVRYDSKNQRPKTQNLSEVSTDSQLSQQVMNTFCNGIMQNMLMYESKKPTAHMTIFQANSSPI